MIFLANVLVMNGGSTFLVRTCRELKRQKIKTVVLLLRRQVEMELLTELERFSKVLYLDDYLIDKAVIFRDHLGVFGPVNWKAVHNTLSIYGNVVHAMGVFGLLFGYRLCAKFNDYKLTAGIYHQNEFIFRRSRFYFPNGAVELFRKLPPENVVFFNDISQKNYKDFFLKDYSFSAVLPIGIDLPDSVECAFSPNSGRIVSVGNLVEFKTYNEHIIRLLPNLRQMAPHIRYDIYGSGPKEQFLKELAHAVGVDDIVCFKGDIRYSNFQNAVAGTTLFVGSGTALLEAAALGIPSLIGIESIRTPETYGFISDIDGYSYNENVSHIEKHSMLKILNDFFCCYDRRNLLSKKCSLKVKSFSVKNTANGFIRLQANSLRVQCQFGCALFSRMIISFIFMVILQRLVGDPLFSERRNQSYRLTP